MLTLVQLKQEDSWAECLRLLIFPQALLPVRPTVGRLMTLVSVWNILRLSNITCIALYPQAEGRDFTASWIKSGNDSGVVHASEFRQLRNVVGSSN